MRQHLPQYRLQDTLPAGQTLRYRPLCHRQERCPADPDRNPHQRNCLGHVRRLRRLLQLLLRYFANWSFSFLITFLPGVYQHLYGNRSGNHGVKILGWGTEDGTPYWLVANSWGTKWAGLGGFFKILRGRNSAGIELNVMGGTPKV
jgi:hypothetical protein